MGAIAPLMTENQLGAPFFGKKSALHCDLKTLFFNCFGQNKTVDELTENDYERKEWKKTVARLMS